MRDNKSMKTEPRKENEAPPEVLVDDEELTTDSTVNISEVEKPTTMEKPETPKPSADRKSIVLFSIVGLTTLIAAVVVVALVLSNRVDCTFPELTNSSASNSEATNSTGGNMENEGTQESSQKQGGSGPYYPEGCDPSDINGPPCAVIGRPFRDFEGREILASVEQCHEEDEHHRGYAAALFPQDSFAVLALQDSPQDMQEDLQQWKAEQAQAWLDRGRAEHASVASFAAFTLALLSNQAPPTLVDRSLQAAQDEIRHARISFGWASRLLGKHFEPAALPPTQHHFGPDLAHLARGTVEEGCVGETMSTFEMIAKMEEVENYNIKNKNNPKEDSLEFWQQQFRASTVQIAVDEARHAALAWKTIRWVCETDRVACKVGVDTTFLNRHSLLQPYEQRVPSLSKIWEETYHHLMPYVVGTRKAVDRETDPVCTSLDPKQLEQEMVSDRGNAMELLKQSIVYHFHCMD